MPMRLHSSLPADTERLMRRVIGCAIEVHRHLGPGFLERIYTEALCYELEMQAIAFEQELSIVVNYKTRQIPGQRVDLLVADRIVVEVKSVARLDPIFQAKTISYMRTTGLRAGLIINFNTPLLKEGLQRIVL